MENTKLEMAKSALEFAQAVEHLCLEAEWCNAVTAQFLTGLLSREGLERAAYVAWAPVVTRKRGVQNREIWAVSASACAAIFAVAAACAEDEDTAMEHAKDAASASALAAISDDKWEAEWATIADERPPVADAMGEAIEALEARCAETIRRYLPALAV